MSQTDRRGSGSSAVAQPVAGSRPNSVGETRTVTTGKPAAAAKAVARVLEVNRPWLQKGLDAIWQWEFNPQERDWLCKRLEFFVASRRQAVCHSTETDVLEYLD